MTPNELTPQQNYEYLLRQFNQLKAAYIKLEGFVADNPPLDLTKLTRVTVVGDARRRDYEGWGLYGDGCELAIQDEGRTLKVLPRGEFQ